MKKQQLGSSELTASRIGLGCMGMSEWYGPANDEESVETIKLAYGMGLNFFDTADVYGNGHNETLLGRAIKKIRNDVIVATKFGFLPRSHSAPTSMNRSVGASQRVWTPSSRY